MFKLKICIILILFGNVINIHAATSETGYLSRLDQKTLRSVLQERIPRIDPSRRAAFLARETVPLFMPKKISTADKNVLEVGGSVCFSLRAFRDAASISAVDPKAEAFALALDPAFRTEADGKQKKSCDNLHTSSEPCVQFLRDNCQINWIDTIKPGEPWIDDRVILYPTTLESLPPSLNGTFDVIVYKDYNLWGEAQNAFIQKLSELLTDGGVAILQFWADDYDGKGLDSILAQNFSDIQSIIDPCGTKEMDDKTGEWKHMGHQIRFKILKAPIRT